MLPNESGKTLFSDLEWINARPKPFEFCTTSELWTDEYTSTQMLKCHLDEDNDLASRRTAFIERSVDWLVSHLGIAAGTRLVDFGCGPGLYTSRLAKHGAQVTGIDFSARSLEYARSQAAARGLDIDYVHQNYLDFITDKRFDVVLMIYCDFCALSPTQRKTLLGKFHSILQPGGRIVMDVHSTVYFDRLVESASYARNLQAGFWSSEPYYGFLNTFKYEAEKVTLDQYTLVGPTWTKRVYNWLQCFSVESLSAEFRESELEVVEVYADVAGKPFEAEADEFAVVATRA